MHPEYFSKVENAIFKLKSQMDRSSKAYVISDDDLSDDHFYHFRIERTENGFGLVAAKDFDVGDLVSCLPISGRMVPKGGCKALFQGKEIPIGADHYVYADLPGLSFLLDSHFGSFINHSCWPKCNIVSSSFRFDPLSHFYIARKPILEGEELTVDYATFENDVEPSGVFECDCGSSECRKVYEGMKGVRQKSQEDMIETGAMHIWSAFSIYESFRDDGERERFKEKYLRHATPEARLTFEYIIQVQQESGENRE